MVVAAILVFIAQTGFDQNHTTDTMSVSKNIQVVIVQTDFNQQLNFAPILILSLFGLVLSVIGFLVVISTELGYEHYITDIVMIVYYWDKIEFYSHAKKPIRFRIAHRLLYSFTIVLFAAIFAFFTLQIVVSTLFYRNLILVLVILIGFPLIEAIYRWRWEWYFEEGRLFNNILKNDTEGIYREDWDRWFKDSNFREKIIEDARERGILPRREKSWLYRLFYIFNSYPKSIERATELRKKFRRTTLTDVRWQNLTFDEMRELGRAAADLLKRKKIILGTDSRKSSYGMLKAFKEGYEKNKGEVINYGIHCTTPMIEYLGRLYGLPSVMITASHLDETWQGMKITPCEYKKKAEYDRKKAFNDYIESFPEKDFKCLPLTVDYLEGSVARIFPVIARRANIRIVEELNAEMSGDFTYFPSKSPNPSIPENLACIIEIMKKNESRVGVVFDDDGDRHVIILKIGNTVKAIDPVLLTAVSAMHYEEPGVFVVDPFVVPAEKAIEFWGHKMVRAKRGRPNMIGAIEKELTKNKTVYKGVEGSYHIYDSKRLDDSIWHVLEFLTYMKNIDIKKAKESIGCQYTLEMRVECKNDKLFKEKVIPALAKLSRGRGLKIKKSDGLWVKNSFVMRKSSREDVVSVLFYGEKPGEEMKWVKRAISQIYEEFAENLGEGFNDVETQQEKFYW